MVEHHVRSRGIANPLVLEAMRVVPREAFVPEEFADAAYDDCALPIADDQTISQPYIVALMVEAAGTALTSRVLEVGTGSGYGAAVLSRVAGHVWSVERLAGLAAAAALRLARLGYSNVSVVSGDGACGWPDGSPYDAVVVTAAAPSVPADLVSQLAPGGRLVMPVGSCDGYQQLTVLRRLADNEGVETAVLAPVRFVPLL